MLVDDDENILKSLTRSLRAINNARIETFLSAEDAIKRAKQCMFDIVISDFQMPGTNGIRFLSEFKTIQPDTIRIILTGCSDSQVIIEAINRANTFKYITKPWDEKELFNTINECQRKSTFIPIGQKVIW